MLIVLVNKDSLNGYNCEGLMVKSLGEDGVYLPSKRSNCWLKIKKDYVDGLTDTIDLVPIGAFYGKGKRNGVFGAYLLAVYDQRGECLQSACKLGTGFTDDDLFLHYTRLQPYIIQQKKCYYDCIMEPDVWLEAREVWECAAADLSISPVHTAARLHTTDGKTPEQSTAAAELLSLYYNQFKSPAAAAAAAAAAATAANEEEEEEEADSSSSSSSSSAAVVEEMEEESNKTSQDTAKEDSQQQQQQQQQQVEEEKEEEEEQQQQKEE
ncbi:DNA ligase 1 precursor, putative [Eimeria maxima]|uniref:DNA ligase 1, putative n=1 Tax=Eimeria maxima TaxID=5804 RepID=U6M3Y7_EIMMA|nr:DNA ligase 1 precursor, putative [Eimeria maxima]CDJ58942.1 DNA ligase 1 precursor, putative [Eimeria maxima]